MTNDLLAESFAVGLSSALNPTAYIGGTSSRIYRVDNAATATPGDEIELWGQGNIPNNTSFLGGTIGCIEVDPNDAGTIYCGMTNVDDRPRIWRIRNANTDNPVWDDLHANLPESLPVNWIEVDPEMSDHLIIGTDYGLYSSLNGGASWNKDTRLPNVPIDQVKLRHSDRKLFIYTHGRGIWSADLKDNLVAKVSQQELNQMVVYPNPTSEYIQFSKTPSQVAIYAMNGAVMYRGNENRINVSNWQAGTYLLDLMLDGATSTRKIVIR